MNDFIKYIIKYADGFEIEIEYLKDDHRIFINYDLEEIEPFELSLWDIKQYILYPLLLQKTIEGINDKEIADIVQTRSNIIVYWYQSIQDVVEFELDPENTDEAKEQALKYIYEQVNKFK